MLIVFAVPLSEGFFDSPYWIPNTVLLVALLGILLIGYFRTRKHEALLGALAPLLDERCVKAQIVNPLGLGEDNVQGRYRGRDVLLSLKEPRNGMEFPSFRVILGAATTMPFVIWVQKRLPFRMVSRSQPGQPIKSGNNALDKRYYVTNLLTPTTLDSNELEGHLETRLIHWLRRAETMDRLDTIFGSYGVDYLCTRVEYPGTVQLSASISGVTAILRHYSKREVSPENVGHILEEISLLLQSTESLLELEPQRKK